jgi:hypothetical protein
MELPTLISLPWLTGDEGKNGRASGSNNSKAAKRETVKV